MGQRPGPSALAPHGRGLSQRALPNQLEEGSYRYVARLSSNPRLERMAWPHVDRIADKAEPEDRTHTVEFSYQAGPWSRPRRVVLVIEERPMELLPHYFFLVTNAPQEEESGHDLVQRYRQRGATEKDYGEWTNALEVALSSTNRPKETYRGEALVHGSEPRTNSPFPPRRSGHPVAVGPPQPGHGVEDLAREPDLGPLATEGPAPHPLTEDGLVPEDCVLHQAPPAVA